MMVGAMYAESMMTILDNMSDGQIAVKMKYVEFLVFLCRITFEHYESTPHKQEAFYKKLDHMLPQFLGYVNLEPIFLFDEKFQSEIKHAVKLYMRKKKKFMQQQREADLAGVELDPKIVVEFKEYEKSIKKLGVNTDALDIGSPSRVAKDSGSSDEEGKTTNKERKTLVE